MKMRAIRGAVSVEEDRRELILAATESLLERMVEENGLAPDDIVSAFITATEESKGSALSLTVFFTICLLRPLPDATTRK